MKGRKVELVEHEEPQSAEVIDLMERLRQSLQGTGAKAPRRTRTAARKTKARGKRKRAA